VYQGILNGTDRRPNPLAPEIGPLTSFTWGCSSDSKNLGRYR
jgi:hypothetical protein